jgi:hypothetical protein
MQRPVRIIPDKKYPNMYRLQWRDKSISVEYYDSRDPMKDGGPNSYGMYNLTRAKDILKNYREYAINDLARYSRKPVQKSLEV